MTSKPVAPLFADLSVTKTHSRPQVSNDNARAAVLASAYATHSERFPAGLSHLPEGPVEVWINRLQARATEATRGGVLDHARPGQLLSAHHSDLRRPGRLEAPA